MARRGLPIRINSVHAGFVDTPLVHNALANMGDAAEEIAAKTVASVPMQRLAKPIEIARPVLFLASNDASFVRGAELVVDGDTRYVDRVVAPVLVAARHRCDLPFITSRIHPRLSDSQEHQQYYSTFHNENNINKLQT